MKLWVTEITAVDPRDRRLKIFAGPNVPGINLSDAEKYCQNNGLGYCSVLGEWIGDFDENGKEIISQEMTNNN